MSISLNTIWLTSFCLGLVRAGGFMIVAPPFSSPAIPPRVKIAIAVALALASVSTAPSAQIDSLGSWAGQLVLQACLGLALGFGVFTLFSAVGVAGELLDLSSGFSAAQAVDPSSGVSGGAMTRVYTLLATTLLFATGGHLLLVRGFVRSGAAVDHISITHIGRGALAASASMLVAGVEIALPIMAALLAAEVGLGLLGKAAPQLNVFQLGFAAKILFTLFLLGGSIAMLPEQVSALINLGLKNMAGVTGG